MQSFFSYNASSQRFDIDDSKISITSSLSTRLLAHSLVQAQKFVRGKLLDIGCGVKPYHSLFSTEQYIGIDWPNSLHPLDVEAYADAQCLPFRDQSIDTILCTEVIEHLKQPWRAVGEMKRVLKPDGHIILSAPFTHWHHEIPHDNYRFTFFGIQSLVSQVGLIPVAIWERGGTGSVLLDIGSRFLSGKLRYLLYSFRFPASLQDICLRVLFQPPQRLFAALVLRKMSRSPSAASLLIRPSAYSLGYTLVAQKPGLSFKQ